jgi:hypothetical protein
MGKSRKKVPVMPAGPEREGRQVGKEQKKGAADVS